MEPASHQGIYLCAPRQATTSVLRTLNYMDVKPHTQPIDWHAETAGPSISSSLASPLPSEESSSMSASLLQQRRIRRTNQCQPPRQKTTRHRPRIEAETASARSTTSVPIIMLLLCWPDSSLVRPKFNQYTATLIQRTWHDLLSAVAKQ